MTTHSRTEVPESCGNHFTSPLALSPFLCSYECISYAIHEKCSVNLLAWLYLKCRSNCQNVHDTQNDVYPMIRYCQIVESEAWKKGLTMSVINGWSAHTITINVLTIIFSMESIELAHQLRGSSHFLLMFQLLFQYAHIASLYIYFIYQQSKMVHTFTKIYWFDIRYD